MPRRVAIPRGVETDLLVACRRRCCLCWYIERFEGVKKGQIAHLNRRRDDNRPVNLVWLCLGHHDEFDGSTSQSKNFTPSEVRQWRDRLHGHFEAQNARDAAPPATVGPATDPSNGTRLAPRSFDGRPELFAYRSRNRTSGVCVIECIPIADGRTVVACISVPGNPGASITNTVETICEQVCLRFGIAPGDVVWLENYDYINPGEWLHVTFGSTPPLQWSDPEWNVVGSEIWESLGLRPVHRLRSRHGELISKLRNRV